MQIMHGGMKDMGLISRTLCLVFDHDWYEWKRNGSTIILMCRNCDAVKTIRG